MWNYSSIDYNDYFTKIVSMVEHLLEMDSAMMRLTMKNVTMMVVIAVVLAH